MKVVRHWQRFAQRSGTGSIQSHVEYQLISKSLFQPKPFYDPKFLKFLLHVIGPEHFKTELQAVNGWEVFVTSIFLSHLRKH